MKDLIIFGTNAFSKQLKQIIEKDSDRRIKAFCLTTDYIKTDTFCGIPIIDFDHLETCFKKDTFEILVSVGYGNMNNNREYIFKKCINKGYNVASYRHSTAKIMTDNIANGNIFLINSFVSDFTKIGNGNIIHNNVIIEHESTIGDYNFFAGAAATAGLVKIASHCFLGAKSVICDEVSIADYNLIGAGVVISSDTESYSIHSVAKTRTIRNASLEMMNYLLIK